MVQIDMRNARNEREAQLLEAIQCLLDTVLSHTCFEIGETAFSKLEELNIPVICNNIQEIDD